MPEEKQRDETEMLQQIAAGNEQAFRQLFDTYRGKLFTYILNITESREAAEDAVHDVFLKIWTGREKLPGIENINAYLYRITHNHALNGMRRMAKETLVMAELEKNTRVKSNDADDTLLRKEIRKFIQDAVNKLTPQQKEVFRMSREDGLKQQEIAQQLNISIFTVKKHLTDALNQLRKEIAQSYGARAVALYVLFSLGQ